MTKRPSVTFYRRAAERCVHTWDEMMPPVSKRTQAHSNTRSPNGMWVEVWVWVPTEAAHMERSKE